MWEKMRDAQVALGKELAEEIRKSKGPKRGGSGRSTANQRRALIGGEEEQREVKAQQKNVAFSGPSSPSCCPAARYWRPLLSTHPTKILSIYTRLIRLFKNFLVVHSRENFHPN